MILTEEQLAIIKEPSKNIFIQACAGSGKTTVIVERFVNEVKNNKSRQGFAVLSFTNIAVDKINHRCISVGQNFLSDFPNFVGTFDSFINRYIILPYSNKKVILIDSWKNFYFEYKGRKIPLSFLKRDINNEFVLNIPEDVKYYEIGNIIKENLINATFAAITRRAKLLEYGYLTSEECRENASRFLVETSSIAINISNRFKEIIVDEAQDCNDTDLRILESLREQGVNIVIVADLNQAIFSFRNANSVNLENFATTHKRMLITGNWRSTKNICNFTAMLKVISRNPDNSLINSTNELPIYIFKYKKRISKELCVFRSERTLASV